MDVIVKLRHKETTFTILSEGFFGYEQAEFMWNDGNYSCDCNRSIHIGEQCDKTFPEMECGNQIELVSLVENQPH